MRKIVFILLIVLVNIGCSKDKDNNNITGKWYVRGLEFNEFYNGSPHYSSEAPDPGAYIELKSDGTMFAVSISSFTSGTWSKNGNTLTFVPTSGITEEWTINKLTSNELELYNTDKDMFPTDYYEATVYMNR